MKKNMKETFKLISLTKEIIKDIKDLQNYLDTYGVKIESNENFRNIKESIVKIKYSIPEKWDMPVDVEEVKLKVKNKLSNILTKISKFLDCNKEDILERLEKSEFLCRVRKGEEWTKQDIKKSKKDNDAFFKEVYSEFLKEIKKFK